MTARELAALAAGLTTGGWLVATAASSIAGLHLAGEIGAAEFAAGLFAAVIASGGLGAAAGAAAWAAAAGISSLAKLATRTSARPPLTWAGDGPAGRGRT